MKIVQGPVKLDIGKFSDELKARDGMAGAGMVLVHNGIVRANDLAGNTVEKIDVKADGERLQEIIDSAEKLEGIIAADAWIVEGTLSVGDDIMLLGIAGDTRNRVIKALAETLDAIKAGVTSKTQHYA